MGFSEVEGNGGLHGYHEYCGALICPTSELTLRASRLISRVPAANFVSDAGDLTTDCTDSRSFARSALECGDSAPLLGLDYQQSLSTGDPPQRTRSLWRF